ncbi:ATP-binding protein, partial [Akkermansiaceae bacterium]|nr:ATP-binding protein [Akkermansiaceae bacterium]
MSVASNRLFLEHHLKKLRLPTMGREWEALATSCAKEGRDYGDYLLGLTERELIEREQRAAGRRIKGAKFPVLKTIDSFDFTAQPTINELLMRQLLSGEYMEARSLFYLGQKTKKPIVYRISRISLNLFKLYKLLAYCSLFTVAGKVKTRQSIGTE